jgi:nucleoside-diphosphate-sugar epimerase
MGSPAVLVLGGQGYVGSAVVTYLQAAGARVASVDLGLRGTPVAGPGRRGPYQDLTAAELADYDGILLLAGHSSVAACDQDPAASFANNVAGFAALVHKLRGQKFLFASSISVHVNTNGREAVETDPLPEPVWCYDFHKQTIERYALLVYPHSYALRFGTVCGPAPNLRRDLLLNSLVWSALHQGRVEVANRAAHRPLLGIHDLCRAIARILAGDVPPGCYHLASVNAQIGAVAAYVAERFGVPCREVEQPTRYDLRAATGKFRAAAGLEFHDDVPGLTDALQAHYLGLAPAARERSLSHGRV